VIKDTLVVNLFAGPGAGKSTTAAAIFAEMKYRGKYHCELLTEVAKNRFWEGTLNNVDDQLFIFARQLYELRCILGKVDMVIMDSPLLSAIVYQQKVSSAFEELVKEIHFEHDSLNVFLERTKKYSSIGRGQTEDEARFIDARVLSMLKDTLGGKFYMMGATREVVTSIVNLVEKRLQK